MMKRTCQNCGTYLTGRMDKKFCSDLCRNTFNNRVNSSDYVVRKTNSILRRNRKILMNLIPAQKQTVHRNVLLRLGFNFQYYTNSISRQNGETLYYCYEFGYVKLEDPAIMLIKQEEGQDNLPVIDNLPEP